MEKLRLACLFLSGSGWNDLLAHLSLCCVQEKYIISTEHEINWFAGRSLCLRLTVHPALQFLMQSRPSTRLMGVTATRGKARWAPPPATCAEPPPRRSETIDLDWLLWLCHLRKCASCSSHPRSRQEPVSTISISSRGYWFLARG